MATETKMEKTGAAAAAASASSVWDCGSTLYDSFELNSFQRQLHSAIASRTFSMPRLSPCLSSENKKPSSSKPKKNKICGSIQRFLRSLIRVKPKSPVQETVPDPFYICAIPAVPEEIEFDSLVRRTASERLGFRATSIRISCA